MNGDPLKEEKQNSPLAVKEPKVTRVSPKKIFVISVIASCIFAFSLVVGLSPKKKVQGKEVVETNNSSPIPPDPVVTAPGTYSELQSGKPAGPPAAKSGYATEANNSNADNNPYQQNAGPDPKIKEEEQLQKDRTSAIASPITFQQESGGGALRNSAPPAMPVMPQTVVPSLRDGLDQLAAGSPSDDQNMQNEKRDFSRKRESELPYLQTTLIPPLSRYEVKAGAVLPALLITGINSDLPGQLTAQIRENVYDTVTGNYLLIPQGTKLIGEYDSQIAFGQERVLVVWTRLIMPNGNSLSLEGMPGIDLSGYAGVTGRVNNHYGKLIAGVVLGSIIGAGAQVATGGQGAPNVPPSFEQLAVSGAAQNINQAGQAITQKNLNRQPTIEVSPGDKINVFVTKDMILKPYKEVTP